MLNAKKYNMDFTSDFSLVYATVVFGLKELAMTQPREHAITSSLNQYNSMLSIRG